MSDVTITLASPTSNASIYYTTDGVSDPDLSDIGGSTFQYVGLRIRIAEHLAFGNQGRQHFKADRPDADRDAEQGSDRFSFHQRPG